MLDLRVTLATLGILLAAASPPPFPGAGVATLRVRDPIGGSALPAVVYYPSASATSTTEVGPYTIAATLDAPPAAGAHPLIVFSHGAGGSINDDHDLDTSLASQGFVVAAVEHGGDDYRDQSGAGTDRVWIGRSLQLSALIDAVLASPALRPLVDAQKIGAMGFSLGGYDVLVLAGAKPNFGLQSGYCSINPNDETFCTGWHVRITRPDLPPPHDPRVRAVLALAPVGVFFDRAALAGVDVPVDLWAAGADQVLLIPGNAARVRDLLPQRPEYTVVPNAGHDVFASPCTARLRAQRPDACTDPPGVDRAAVHAAIVNDAVRFFTRSLGLGS